MTDGYALPRPGAANHSEEDRDAETAAKADLPDPGSKLGFAHYSGMSVEGAQEAYKHETLCVSCLSSPVCKIAAGVEEPLAVVSRCLSYLPMGG